MTDADVVALRGFLRGLADGHFSSSTIPDVMFRIARKAVGPHEPDDLVEDVLGETLLKLVSAGNRRSPGSPSALLELEDRRLAPVLVHRMRQAMTGLFPRWKTIVKPLRTHVRSILKVGVQPGGELPTSLLSRNGNLCARHVAVAVAAVLAQPEAPPSTTEALTAVLVDIYFAPERFPNHEPNTETPTVADLVAHRHDVHVQARDVERLLGENLVDMVTARAGGSTLTDIGDAHGVGASTVHARLYEGIQKLRRSVGRWSSPATTAGALQLLASRSRR